ncbi:MAG: 5'-methylthioadenosine/S-adenosylhomocysteine nucleosidase [Gammaproteobacteria bacterium]|nr:5'-methylthioadenosine/S-adenosylhomocysteine nucleosidase [Gammaproteobacteria bacterium]
MTDCALIAALPKERDAILFHLRGWQVASPTDSPCTFYESITPNGLNVVAAMTTGMGQLHAASLTTDLLSRYKPKSVILVGITGGMDRDIHLGDVVASEQIVDYELGKMSSKGFGPRWSVYRTDYRLLNLIQNWQNQNWQHYIRPLRPDKKFPDKSKLHTGIYLSGNKVIADERTAGSLKAFWQKAAAIDMESAGVAAAIEASPFSPGLIVLKSVCDYADCKKNDSWQMYAADAAASCAVSFITDQLKPSEFQETTTSVERPAGQLAGYDFRDIRIAVCKAYDLGELKVLCADLEIDWDELTGERKSEKVTSLLKFLQRRNQLIMFFNYVNQDRDNLINALEPIKNASIKEIEDFMIVIIKEQQNLYVKISYGESARECFTWEDLDRFEQENNVMKVRRNLEESGKITDLIDMLRSLSERRRKDVFQKGKQTFKKTWEELGEITIAGQTDAGQKAEKMIADVVVEYVKKQM